MRILALTGLLVLAGCAAYSERAAHAKMCRQPGHATDMRCARLPRQLKQDLVLICERRGASRNDARDCYWIARQDLARVLREIQGQR